MNNATPNRAIVPPNMSRTISGPIFSGSLGEPPALEEPIKGLPIGAEL